MCRNRSIALSCLWKGRWFSDAPSACLNPVTRPLCLETHHSRAALAAQRNKTGAADALDIANIIRTRWLQSITTTPTFLRHGAGIAPDSQKGLRSGGRSEIGLILTQSACILLLIYMSFRCRPQFNRICIGMIRGGSTSPLMLKTQVVPENSTDCL